MNSKRHNVVILVGILLFSTLLGSVYGSTGYQTKMLSSASKGFPIDSSGSWNPLVPCTSPPIVRITDITDNMTQNASYNNSPFSAGITPPRGFKDNADDGGAKRWLTSGDSTIHPPTDWVSPGPGCTITNSRGQTVASFVEIDGVKRTSLAVGDCDDYNSTDRFDPLNGGGPMGAQYCDTTLNIYDPSIVPNISTACQSPSDPSCYGIIHVEIDHDWKAAGYCPSNSKGWSCNANVLNSSTTTHTLLDVQGFVYWDANHTIDGINYCETCDPAHSFSGWEIHPFTAWRIHQSTSTTTSSASSSSFASSSSSSLSRTITSSHFSSFSSSSSTALSHSTGSKTTASTTTTTTSSSSTTTSVPSAPAPITTTSVNHYDVSILTTFVAATIVAVVAVGAILVGFFHKKRT